MSSRLSPALQALRIGLALATAGLAGTPHAHASGLLVARMGGEMGHVTTDDPSAIYFNPAGVALHPGHLRIHLEGLLAWRWAAYERPEGAIDNKVPEGQAGAGTPADGVAANAGRATMMNILPQPFIALSSDFGVKGLGVGLAFFAPIGGQASWSPNEAFRDNPKYPGAVDGVQRWAAIDGVIRALYASASVAYHIEKARLSIGASANLVINQMSSIRARTSTGTDDLLSKNGALLEGRSLLDASGMTGSLGLGVIAQPVDNVWIGLSYQSQPGFGENTLKGELTNKLGGAPVGTQQVEVKWTMPDVVRLGARYRATEEIELRLSAEYARWSTFKNICVLDAANPMRACKMKADGSPDAGSSGVILNIPRNWQDAFGIRLGASYFPRPEVEVYLGAGYDSNAIPDAAMDASLFDMDKMTFSVGGRFWMLKRHFGINVGYTQIAYLEREVAPRARDMNGAPVTPLPPSRSPDGAGRYMQAVGLLNLALEYMF